MMVIFIIISGVIMLNGQMVIGRCEVTGLLREQR